MSVTIPVLLAALCSAAVSPADSAETQQQATAGLYITPGELWQLIDRAVTAATQPLAIKLDGRADTLDARLNTLDSRLDTLDSRLFTLDSRLDAFDSKLDTPNARLDALDSKLDTLDFRLDSLDSRLDSLDSRLDVFDTRVDTLTENHHRHDSELGSINDRVDNQTIRSEENAKQLDDHKTQLQGQEARLDTQAARLDTMASQLDGHGLRLDGQASELDEHNSEMTRQASRIVDQKSRLDNHTYQLGSHQSSLDEHSSQIDEQESRLDMILNRTDIQKTRIDGNTLRLNKLQTLSSLRDCSDLPPGSDSGIYLLQPGLEGTTPVPAYCDMDTDGGNWTVLQRRADIQPRQDFFLKWDAYKDGFGELDREFWWGLHNMWVMTSPRDRKYELRINLEDFEDETRFAIYRNFRISSRSDSYRLSVTNYTGNAGDDLVEHTGQAFSTKDRDHDTWSGSCAKLYKGGWWYSDCSGPNINGQHLSGSHSTVGGVNWKPWKGEYYSLKTVVMKIRPIRKSLN